jgi:hypothetical protein
MTAIHASHVIHASYASHVILRLLPKDPPQTIVCGRFPSSDSGRRFFPGTLRMTIEAA